MLWCIQHSRVGGLDSAIHVSCVFYRPLMAIVTWKLLTSISMAVGAQAQNGQRR